MADYDEFLNDMFLADEPNLPEHDNVDLMEDLDNNPSILED